MATARRKRSNPGRRIGIYLSAEWYVIAEKAARKCGLPVTTFLRDRAMAGLR